MLISSAMSFFGSILLSEIISFISEAAITRHLIELNIPQFYLMFCHLFLFLQLYLLNQMLKADALFLKPDLNLSKIPIKY